MKDKLAKLLATENIFVEQRNVPTASFDTKNRTLILPNWKDVTEELECMLIGHEVGHALYTPAEGWSSISSDPRLRRICNVVEDARIERKMKIKYPGITRDFYEGYKSLHERDFFGLKDHSVDEYGFLDRINLHFKIGYLIKINFTEEEYEFVRKIENVKTWKDVVFISNKIYSYLEELAEQDEETMFSDLNSNDGLGDNEGGEEEEGEEDFDDEIDGVMEDVYEKYFESKTMDSFDSNISEKLLDPNCKTNIYIDISDVEYEHRILKNSKLMKIFEEDEKSIKDYFNYPEEKTKLWNKFLTTNNKVINYLVKEFEMKKAADAYVRAKESKSGVIATNKLHAYKLINDIFRKNTVLPQSKNHGLVMFVDFSGSMKDNMKGTIEQLLCLTLFCRRINIPHRIYAFTNQIFNKNYEVDEGSLYKIESQIVIDPNVRLIELFTEKMNNKSFSDTAKCLLVYSNESNRYHSGRYPGIRLNSTPLNETLILARSLINDFKKTTKSQIVNAIILTDGEADNVLVLHNSYLTKICGNIFNNRASRLCFRDKQNKKQIYPSEQSYGFHFTDIFVEMLKKRCDINLICYRIERSKSSIRRMLRSDYESDYEKNLKFLNKNKYLHLTDMMNFSDYFLLFGGDELNVEDPFLEKEDFKTNGSLARAFIKANVKRGTSRVMLSKFIEKIS